MPMQVQCPGCSSKFKLKEAPAKTKKMKCPKCETIITVNPPGEDELEEVGAAAPAKAKATRKAPAKAAAGTKKKAGQKRKAKPAPADDWDLDGFDDDFEDGAGDDDFGDDDFDAPTTRRRRSGGSKSGKAPAKGKGKGKKGKKAEAKSGGKGKIILFVVLGLVVVGGAVGGIVAFSGGGDSTETASNDNAGDAAAGDNGAAVAPDQGADNGGGEQPAVADTAPADAGGQNVFDLKYLPASTDLLIRLKVSDVWNAPFLANMIGQIPPDAMEQSPVKPEDIEVVTLGMNIDPQMAARQAQGGGGQEIPPFVAVAKLTRSLSAQDLAPAFNGTEDYNGQTLHKLQMPPGAAPACMWFAESQLLVAGTMVEVKAAIDSQARETRMARFDFVDQSSQLVLAFATDDVAGFEALQQQQLEQVRMAVPGLEEFQGLMQSETLGSGLGVNIYNDIRLSVQAVFKDSSAATQAQGELQQGLDKLVTQLEEQKQGNPFFGAIFDIGIKAVKAAKPAVSGSTVSMVASLSEDDLKRIQSNPIVGGLLQAGMGGGGPMAALGGGSKPFVEIEQTSISFNEDIQGIIRWRCRKCHVNEAQGGFSLADYNSLMAHDSAKGKAVTPGDPDASTFYTMVSGGEAPHDLKEDEAERIRAWIKAGAKPPGETADVNALPPVAHLETKPSQPPTGNGFGGSGFGAGGTPAAGGGSLSYAKDIEPIMKKHCAKCHINRQQGNFSLASLQAFATHSGRSGRALTKGNASQSSLYTLVQSGRMPKGPTKLSSQEVDQIKKWIDGGANP